MAGLLSRAGEALFGAGWELRRRAYAAGWLAPRAVASRVVSVGNLTVGGTGKTTLTLHLAAAACARGIAAAVVCRRYRPGPGGHGDEELLYARVLGPGRVFAGVSKREEAERAAGAGARLILVDDGFSHWGLERDLDVVLLDASDPWGGRRLLPAGRLREPIRALQRAEVVVVSRAEPGEHTAALLAEVARAAPAATLATGRHRYVRVSGLDGETRTPGGPAHLVTATGNPGAVERTATLAGYAPVTLAAYRDHHWFSAGEVRKESAAAARAGAALLLTAKDAVRWPRVPGVLDAAVLEVAWEWTRGGDEVERRVFGATAASAGSASA